MGGTESAEMCLSLCDLKNIEFKTISTITIAVIYGLCILLSIF